jgi:hypothetical protein
MCSRAVFVLQGVLRRYKRFHRLTEDAKRSTQHRRNAACPASFSNSLFEVRALRLPDDQSRLGAQHLTYRQSPAIE